MIKPEIPEKTCESGHRQLGKPFAHSARSELFGTERPYFFTGFGHFYLGIDSIKDESNNIGSREMSHLNMFNVEIFTPTVWQLNNATF